MKNLIVVIVRYYLIALERNTLSQIITELAENLFRLQFAEKKEFHLKVVDELVRFFKLIGCSTWIEYVVPSTNIRRSRVDLYAYKSGFSVGCEFDNGRVVKNKSIEKMIELSPMISLFIVRTGDYSDNETRLLKAKYGLKSNEIYFITLNFKKIIRIIPDEKTYEKIRLVDFIKNRE